MRKGLTLMELLVVISILATLAALLFPIYLSVRLRTDLLSCANQLRQIGLAMHMYVKDYGDDTPYSLPSMDFGKYYGFGKSKSRRSVISIAALYPDYVRSKDLLVCPSLRKFAPSAVEEAHRIHEERTYQFFGFRCPWSSYFLFDPFALDRLAEEDPEGLKLSFAEVFAKRGGQTPIAYCDVHQNGCPDHDNFYRFFVPEPRCPPPKPDAPMVILRWSGMVSLVYKTNASTDLVLMIY